MTPPHHSMHRCRSAAVARRPYTLSSSVSGWRRTGLLAPGRSCYAWMNGLLLWPASSPTRDASSVSGCAHGTGHAVRLAKSGSRPADKVGDNGGPTVRPPLPGSAQQTAGASRPPSGSPSLLCRPLGGLAMNAQFASRILLILCHDPGSRVPGPLMPSTRVGYMLLASVVTAETTTDAVACAERSAAHGCSCLEPTRG